MMKPEPSDVTWRGVLDLGPRKFLNRSSSGEPGGRSGMALCGGAFRVWLVEILTTVGSSLSARSAKESGAGRAAAGSQAPKAASTTMAQPKRARRFGKGRICSFLGTEEVGIGGSLGSKASGKQVKAAIAAVF